MAALAGTPAGARCCSCRLSVAWSGPAGGAQFKVHAHSATEHSGTSEADEGTAGSYSAALACTAQGAVYNVSVHFLSDAHAHALEIARDAYLPLPRENSTGWHTPLKPTTRFMNLSHPEYLPRSPPNNLTLVHFESATCQRSAPRLVPAVDSSSPFLVGTWLKSELQLAGRTSALRTSNVWFQTTLQHFAITWQEVRGGRDKRREAPEPPTATKRLVWAPVDTARCMAASSSHAAAAVGGGQQTRPHTGFFDFVGRALADESTAARACTTSRQQEGKQGKDTRSHRVRWAHVLGDSVVSGIFASALALFHHSLRDNETMMTSMLKHAASTRGYHCDGWRPHVAHFERLRLSWMMWVARGVPSGIADRPDDVLLKEMGLDPRVGPGSGHAPDLVQTGLSTHARTRAHARAHTHAHVIQVCYTRTPRHVCYDYSTSAHAHARRCIYMPSTSHACSRPRVRVMTCACGVRVHCTARALFGLVGRAGWQRRRLRGERATADRSAAQTAPWYHAALAQPTAHHAH